MTALFTKPKAIIMRSMICPTKKENTGKFRNIDKLTSHMSWCLVMIQYKQQTVDDSSNSKGKSILITDLPQVQVNLYTNIEQNHTHVQSSSSSVITIMATGLARAGSYWLIHVWWFDWDKSHGNTNCYQGHTLLPLELNCIKTFYSLLDQDPVL